jgi:hypothetical protein
MERDKGLRAEKWRARGNVNLRQAKVSSKPETEVQGATSVERCRPKRDFDQCHLRKTGPGRRIRSCSNRPSVWQPGLAISGYEMLAHLLVAERLHRGPKADREERIARHEQRRFLTCLVHAPELG